MKRLYIYFVYLLLYFTTSSVVLGQKPNLDFEHLNVKEGLSDITITCSIQDQQGFMWFGTYNGLNRYDGYEFKSFQHRESDSTSLQDNVVSCLFQDHRGMIWVGSFSGRISIYNPETETFSWFTDGDHLAGRPNQTVNAIYEDHDNNIWIGTEVGLWKISPDRTKEEHFACENSKGCSEGLSGSKIFDLVEDKWQRLWIATNHKKLTYLDLNSGDFKQVSYCERPFDEPEKNEDKNFFLESDSILWIGSNHGGLSRLNILSFDFKTTYANSDNNSPTTNFIRDIQLVGEELWLATDGGGLDIYHLPTKTFSNYTHSNIWEKSLSNNAIWSITLDRQGIVWLGNFNGGVNKYDPRDQLFKLLENNPLDNASLPNYPIISLLEDESGDLLIGTDWGGLVRLDQAGKYHPVADVWQHNNKPIEVPKALAKDKLGNLLVGTFNEGLYVLSKDYRPLKNIKVDPSDPDGLPSNHVWSMLTDSRGKTWLGTLDQGIAIYDPIKQTIKKLDIDYRNAGHRVIYHIFEDSQSNIWFSTDFGVIYYHRRSEKWELIDYPEVSDKNHEALYVKAIYEDNFRHIWLATGAGLVKYTPEKNEFRLFGENIGLPERSIVNLIDDNFGNLIIISNTYVAQFDLSKQKLTAFRVDNNHLSLNCLLKRKNGKELLVGGVSGVTSFDPKFLTKNEYIPPVWLTEFQIFNKEQMPGGENSILEKSIAYTDLIHLDYDQSVISFKYTALNYTETDRNQFAYKLEGFDEDWVYAKNRRFLTYTSLDPGKYTFMVKASNNNDVWNETPKTITLIVHPPFWKTIWFRFVMIMGIAITIYGMQRVRLQQIRRVYELKSLKSEKEIIRLKNDNLKEELESTKSELANITMNYLHKNQKLQQIQQKMKNLGAKLNPNEQKSMERIVKELDNDMKDDEYWDKFEHHFNKSHNNFLERFKNTFPDLSKRELRLCAYLRMGLDNQEMATLMNVSLRTVETTRYRIRKKIAMEERKSLTKMILRF